MTKAACVVGVDWGEVKHAYEVETDEGQHGGQFDASPESVHRWVRELRAKHADGTIVVALEQSRGALMYALQQYDFLELVPVNPRAAKAYRDSLFLSGAKDDPVDARLLCDFVRVHRSKLRAWRADDAVTRKLRLLVQGRRKLVENRTAITQALSAALHQFFPQVLSCLGDANSKLVRAFLSRWPTAQAARRARPDVIARVLSHNSRKKPAEIDVLVLKIRRAIPVTNDPAIVDSMSLLAESYLAMLEPLECAIRRHDEQIAGLWGDHPDQTLFESFPGGGPVMAPRLAVAFGTDRDRYQQASEMQRYSGIAPVIERSGKQSWTHARWRCPKFLRQTFHEFAEASLPHSAWALAYYRQQRDRGAGHHAAIRSLAFRWIRILFHCWKNKIAYDEQLHIEMLKRRGSPVVNRIAA